MKKTLFIFALVVTASYVGAGIAWEAAKFSNAAVDTVQLEVVAAGAGMAVVVDWLRRLFL